MNTPICLDLEDYKPRYLDEPERWNDWYFVVNFLHQGKEYFLTLTINEGTIMGGSSNRLSFSSDPFTFENGKYINVAVEDVHEITINNKQELGSLKFADNGEHLVAEIDQLTALIRTEKLTITPRNEKTRGGQ